MTNYGLSKYQIQKANDKLQFNKDFMNSNGVELDNKMIPFADFVSNSYMNSDRYVAELQHRAWSVFDYAKEKNLSNVFLTLTLPSVWHAKKTFKNKLINNKKFGGRTYITTINKIKFINARITQNIPFIEPILCFKDTIDKYTPRNASKELSRLLKRFFDDRSYKSIEKHDRCYFRVTEPHKDGTPHVHMSLFIPEQNKETIVKSLNRLFPVPQSKIETDVDSPVAYLMKYVLKTLDDLREEDSKITNLTLWYLYHGISRFYTSRTFISLEVYRKLNGMYSLLDLSQKYITNDICVYVYSDTKRIALIENEYGTIYIPKPVNWSQKLDDADRLGDDGTVQLDSGFESIYKDKSILKPIDLLIDGEEFIIHNYALEKFKEDNKKLLKLGNPLYKIHDIMIKVSKAPYQMSDYELHKYFNDIDIRTVNPAHYVVATNEMINRGLIVGERLNLTDLNDVGEVF